MIDKDTLSHADTSLDNNQLINDLHQLKKQLQTVDIEYSKQWLSRSDALQTKNTLIKELKKLEEELITKSDHWLDGEVKEQFRSKLIALRDQCTAMGVPISIEWDDPYLIAEANKQRGSINRTMEERTGRSTSSFWWIPWYHWLVKKALWAQS